MSEKTDGNAKLSRREFLKATGVASAVLSLAGASAGGVGAGTDFDTFTGWGASFEGGDQYFDGKAYEVDEPTYKKVGTSRRADPRVEGRGHFGTYKKAKGAGWTPDQGIDALPPHLAAFYKENPDSQVAADYRHDVLEPLQKENQKKYGLQWQLSKTWSSAYSAVKPARPDSPPEEWDYRNVPDEALKFKTPDHAAELIKKVAHTFGATLVGITRLNPDWVYSHDLRGAEKGPYDVPEHWEYAIAVTTPHEWGQMAANPTYGLSSDAYNRSSIAGARLESFIQRLGYSARLHSPNSGYDLLAVPVCIDAGIGEQGRHIFSIAPELGSNHRPAIITTSLPMTIDKPIDFGVQDFCKNCQICADYCPGNSIFNGDDAIMTVRGYEHWYLDPDACYNFWGTALGNGGCRVCLAVCPYSRKANWVHKTAAAISRVDPTGLADLSLVWMQDTFFPSPEKEEYYPPNHPDGDGWNASYRPGPEWMLTEKWFDVEVTW